MSLDPTKIQFATVDFVDKVPIYSTKTDNSGGVIGSDGFLSALAASPPNSQVTYATITNPYGKRCLITLSWSLDHVNYYPVNVPIFYYDAVHAEYLWQAVGFAGCSDSLIYLCCTSQYGSPQTVYMQFALDSPT